MVSIAVAVACTPPFTGADRPEGGAGGTADGSVSDARANGGSVATGGASGANGKSGATQGGSSGAAGAENAGTAGTTTMVDGGDQNHNATATQLLFQVEPANGATNFALKPTVTVAAVDGKGNVVKEATSEVTLSLDASSNTGGAGLTGTTTIGATDGVATFADLAVNKTGKGYRLIATAPGLAPATSDVFDVAAWRYSGPDGASITSLAASGSTVYAVASLASRVFGSTDSGKTWRTCGPVPLAQGLLAVSPSDSNTVYLGNQNDGSVNFLKSMDGCASWSPADSGLEVHVGAIVVDQKSGAIYVESGSQIYRSTDGAASWKVRTTSTLDAIRALAIDPKVPDHLYAAGGLGVFQSTDAGAHWTSIINGLTSKNVFCLLVDGTAPQTIYAGTDHGVFRTIDGGANWTSANKGISPDGQSASNASIESLAIVPTTPPTVYALAYALHQGQDTLYRSTDPGNSWSKLKGGIAPALAASQSDETLFVSDMDDSSVLRVEANGSASNSSSGLRGAPIYSLASEHSAPGTVLAAMGPQVAKTTDGGATWTRVEVKSGPTQFNLSWVPGSESVYAIDSLVDSSARLFTSLDGGSTWGRVDSSGTLPTKITVGATSPSLVLYGTDKVNVAVSKDRGATWSTPCQVGASGGCLDGLPWEIFVSPIDSTKVYAASVTGASQTNTFGSVWLSTDQAAHFMQPNSGFSGLLRAIDAKGNLYAMDSGHVYRSNNGGNTWSTSAVQAQVPFPSMIIDPRDTDAWYLVGGPSALDNRLIRTTNAGTSFEEVTPPFQPTTQITALEMDGAGRLYVATDSEGVFESASGGK